MKTYGKTLFLMSLLVFVGFATLPVQATTYYDVTITITSIKIVELVDGESGNNEYQLQSWKWSGAYEYSDYWSKKGTGQWWGNTVEDVWGGSRMDVELTETLYNVPNISGDDFCFKVVETDYPWGDDDVAPQKCFDITVEGQGYAYTSSEDSSTENKWWGRAYISL